MKDKKKDECGTLKVIIQQETLETQTKSPHYKTM